MNNRIGERCSTNYHLWIDWEATQAENFQLKEDSQRHMQAIETLLAERATTWSSLKEKNVTIDKLSKQTHNILQRQTLYTVCKEESWKWKGGIVGSPDNMVEEKMEVMGIKAEIADTELTERV